VDNDETLCASVHAKLKTMENTVDSSFDPNCELCEAARFTHWYAEDDICWVADCEVCLVPMVVWKPHGVAPTDEAIAHMHAVLGAAADQRFGAGEWNLDTTMRQIPDHFHAHARDEDWHRNRNQRRLSRYNDVGAERILR